MEKGTLGEWDGERWVPVDDDEFTRRVKAILASEMAAALADPDVGSMSQDERDHTYDVCRRLVSLSPVEADALTQIVEENRKHAAKGLAGFLLERVTETKAPTD